MRQKAETTLTYQSRPIAYVSCRIFADQETGMLQYALFFSGSQGKVIVKELPESEMPDGFLSDDPDIKSQAIQDILDNSNNEEE